MKKKKKTGISSDIVVASEILPSDKNNSKVARHNLANEEENEEDIDDADEENNGEEIDHFLDQLEDSHLPATKIDHSQLVSNDFHELTKSDDPLKRYIQQISRYKLLTIEEERSLTKKLVETGDIEVAKLLVQANLRLVVKIAMEYRQAYQNILDLIQEGNIGLMKAVSKYNPEKGAKLSYYASWWIKSYILKYILDNFRLVRIGTTAEQKKIFYNLMREKELLIQQGFVPDNKMLAEKLGVSEKSMAMMNDRLSTHGTEVSLDRPLDDNEGGATFSDLLVADIEPIDEKLANEQGIEILKDQLDDFLKELKPRDLEIFKDRLLSEVPLSLQEIANKYGVSRERIRQIEERLLEKLKIYMSQYLR